MDSINPATTSPGAERRREPRLTVIGLADIVPFDGWTGREALRAGVRDVSGGGIGLVLAAPLRFGERFVVRVPDGTFPNAAGVLYLVRGARPLTTGGFAAGAIFLSAVRRAGARAPPAAVDPVRLAAVFRDSAVSALRPDEREIYDAFERRIAAVQLTV